MSEQTDGQFDTQDTQTQQDTPAVDPVMARLDELTSRFDQLQAPVQQDTRGITDFAMQQFEPEADPDPEPDYGYEEDDAQAEQRAFEQLQKLVQEQVTQGVQQHIQPFIVRQQAEALEAKYPDLAKPEVAARVMQQAEQFAQQLGQPNLAGSPALIEKLYLAERAGNLAAQETPADGGTGVHLESGGGQPQQQQMDERDRIVNMGRTQPNSFGWT